jgi:hypothetical protein
MVRKLYPARPALANLRKANPKREMGAKIPERGIPAVVARAMTAPYLSSRQDKRARIVRRILAERPGLARRRLRPLGLLQEGCSRFLWIAAWRRLP